MTVIDSANLTPNALKVLEKRYLKKDETGKLLETPDAMFRRVAAAIASAELNYGKTPAEIALIEKEFYEMITSLAFLPNSPTLMNAGRPLGQFPSRCRSSLSMTPESPLATPSALAPIVANRACQPGSDRLFARVMGKSRPAR